MACMCLIRVLTPASSVLLATACLLSTPSIHAQSAPSFAPQSTTKPASLSCSIRNTPPSPADIAFSHSKYDEAAGLYRKDAETPSPEGDRAHNGLIRSLLKDGKVSDANADATAWAVKSPQSSWAMASLSEVQFRQASMDKAVASMQAAGSLDHCNMQVHADFAAFSKLTGMKATAKLHLDLAHTYEPQNLAIREAWVELQPRSVRLAELTHTLDQDKSLTANQRKWMELDKKILSEPDQLCRLGSAVTSTTIPFHGIKDGPTGKVEWGLIVAFNGKERRMEIDTGASGLTLSHAAATAMHLTPEIDSSSYGMGDEGSQKSFLAKVDSIKIGGLQFENCYVEVFKSDPAGFEEIDGLIGSDVFDDFLLTLDFPGQQVKLDPLPPIPGAPSSAGMALTTQSSDMPVQDAYIDPSMKTWSAIERIGHELILPVRLNGKSTKLFILDTGADATFISTTAAREVTKIGRSPDLGIYGISGQLKDTYLTGDIKLDFAGLRYPAHDLVAFDTAKLFGRDEIEISGLLGAGILRQLTMRIDYRDDLVNFTYDPTRLTHCMPGVYREDCYE